MNIFFQKKTIKSKLIRRKKTIFAQNFDDFGIVWDGNENSGNYRMFLSVF